MSTVLLKTAEGFLAVVVSNGNTLKATVIDRTFSQCYQYYNLPVKLGISSSTMDINAIKADTLQPNHIRLGKLGGQRVLFIGRLGLYGGSDENANNRRKSHSEPTPQLQCTHDETKDQASQGAAEQIVDNTEESRSAEYINTLNSEEQSLLVEIVSSSNVARNAVLLNTFRSTWMRIMEKFDWQWRSQLLRALRREQMASELSLDEINDILYLVYNSTDFRETLLNMNSSGYKELKKRWIQSKIVDLNGSDSDMESLLTIILELPWNILMIEHTFNIIGNSGSRESVLSFFKFIKQEQVPFSLVLRVLRNYSECDNKRIAELKIEVKNRLFITKIDEHFPAIANMICKKIGALIQTLDLTEFLEYFSDKQKHNLDQYMFGIEAALDNLKTFQCSSIVWKKVFKSLNDNFNPSEWHMVSHDVIVAQTFGSSIVYNANDLVDKIVKQTLDSNHINHKNLLNDLDCINIAFHDPYNVLQSPIAEWNESDIHRWTDLAKTSLSLPSQQEILAVIKRAVQLSHKFSPRPVQLLSLLIFLNYAPDKGYLQQIGTGEGKSIIVAMLAAIHAIRGFRVDVVTTSTELSIPEVKRQRPFFEMLKLTVDENSQPGKKSAYECDIVYGTAADFQGDILRTEFLGNDCRGSRNHQVVIVDEVDSMLYDNRMHIVSLAEEAPGMTHLETPLAAIWDFVNRTQRQIVHRNGKDYYITEDFEDENESISLLSGGDWGAVAVEVQDKRKFIIEHGIVFVRKLLRELSDVENQEYCHYKHQVWNISKKEEEISYAPEEEKDDLKRQCDTLRNKLQESPWNRRHPIVDIPEHLRSFALAQASKWITNAILALWCYKKDAHYTVVNGCIVPINYNETGMLQANMIWSDGLTQFLQLKEGLRMDPEGISTNFLSNVSFFQRYGSIYGMTGTLGEESTQAFLRSMYNTDMIIIPPHKHIEIMDNAHSSYHCKELEPLVISDLEQWYDATKNAALYHAKHERGILVICKFISHARHLYNMLKNHHTHDKIFLYIGENKVFEKTTIDSGEIIIATNIAGRGTDLETTESVEKHGGMCVLVTFLPDTYRVEMQNVGRTARKGNRGMAQLIIHDEDNLSIEELKRIRRMKEIEANAEAINDAKRILVQDALFKQFCELENKHFPCVDDIQNMHTWNLLWNNWTNYYTKHMDPSTMKKKWKKHLQKVEYDFWRFIFDLTDEERSALTESAIQKMFNERIEIEKTLFAKNYEKKIRKKFCDQNSHIPKELLDCFEKAKKYEPKYGNTLTNIKCSIYDRKGAEEVWGIWLKKKNIIENELPLEQAMESYSREFVREFEYNARYNNLIKNPFYYVRKGNELLSEKDIEGSIFFYNKAISLDPTFSLNARYNKALALLTKPDNKSHQQEALDELNKAKKLIVTVYRPNILIFNALLANGTCSSSTSQHALHQLDIILKHEEYIQGAIETIENALKKRKNVMITLKKLKDVFTETEDNHEKAIHEAATNGLTHLFVVEKKLPPWKNVVGVALIGLIQVVVRYLLLPFHAHAVLVTGTSTGVTNVIGVACAAITGNFSWSTSALEIAMGIAFSIIGAGINGIMAAVGVHSNRAANVLGDRAVPAKMDEVERAVKQVEFILAKCEIKELMSEADSYCEKRLTMQKLENEICSSVVEKLETAFLNNPIIVKALKDDEKHESNFWKSEFIKEGFKLLDNENENLTITKIIREIEIGVKLPEELLTYIDEFIRQFEEKISEYEPEINLPECSVATFDNLNTSQLININTSHMIALTQNIELINDPLNTTQIDYHARTLQSNIIEESTPKALVNAFKCKLIDKLSDSKQNARVMEIRALRSGVEKFIVRCETSVDEFKKGMKAARDLRHDSNRIANAPPVNSNIGEEPGLGVHTKQLLEDISTGEYIHDATIFALIAAAINSRIYVYDEQDKLIDVKDDKFCGEPMIVRHLPVSKQYPAGHFEPQDHSLMVIPSGPNMCAFDSVFAQLNPEQKMVFKLENPAALCDRVIRYIQTNSSEIETAYAFIAEVQKIAPDRLLTVFPETKI